MPVNAETEGRPIGTGVDGRVFTPTAQWLQTLEAVRARERRLSALLPRGEERELLLRRLIAGEAQSRISPRAVHTDTETFCRDVLSVPGDGRSVRDLRERARVLLYLRGGAALPRVPEDLLRLWTGATRADPGVCGGRPAHFRQAGEHIPFSGTLPGGEVPRGWETVSPGEILRETEGLLRWIRADVPPEVRAVCAFFLFGRIHPFCDGNGRTLRMLTCALLSKAYSEPVLLSFLERLQSSRLLLTEEESRTNAGREDLSGFGSLLLRILGLAQNRLMIVSQSGA